MITLAARVFTRVVLPIVAGYLIGLFFTGCSGALRNLDEINDPQDDVTLKRCREEARAARDAGVSPRGAYDAYERCKHDAGLP